MDLSVRAFALYRKLTTLFSAERYHRTGESSIAQNGEGDVYDQSPYGLEDQMVSHSFRALRHSVIEWIGVQAFVLLYSPSPNTSQLAAGMKARRTLRSLGEGG